MRCKHQVSSFHTHNSLYNKDYNIKLETLQKTPVWAHISLHEQSGAISTAVAYSVVVALHTVGWSQH